MNDKEISLQILLKILDKTKYSEGTTPVDQTIDLFKKIYSAVKEVQ
jgi:hypothetical protein